MTAQRTYSQAAAAGVLKIHPNTMANWRKRGLIRPELIVSTPAADLGIPVRNVVLYDADAIDEVAAGKAPLAVSEPEPEPAA